jgi:hypothetical protein
MSTIRIINGIEYTIPPGTEHVWTPPDEVVVSSAPNETTIAENLDRLLVHKLVRDQNSETIENLVNELTNIWKEFTNKSINSNQLAEELSSFRLTRLITSEAVDDITIQSFEEAMVKMMGESTKL